MNKKSADRRCVFSLKMLAAMFDVPGGANAMEMLLLAVGFLTGAYRSSNPHLPYQRYLDLGYFLVIDREVPSKWKAYTYCVTNKGLAPVIERLKTSVYACQMLSIFNFNMNPDKWRCNRKRSEFI